MWMVVEVEAQAAHFPAPEALEPEMRVVEEQVLMVSVKMAEEWVAFYQ